MYKKLLLIPKQAKRIIEQNTDNPESYYRVIHTILSDRIIEGVSPLSWKYLPSTLLKKVFSNMSNYSVLFKDLIEWGVIECTTYRKGRCKAYKLNPKMISTDEVYRFNSSNVRPDKRIRRLKKQREILKYTRSVILPGIGIYPDIKAITDYLNLSNKVKDRFKRRMCENGPFVKGQILYEPHIRIKSGTQWIQLAQNLGSDLVCDTKTGLLIIGPYEDIIHAKTYEITRQIQKSLAKIYELQYKQNKILKYDSTVGRMHTNFTNIPARCFTFIKYRGQDFIEFDLKNSQLVFLARFISDIIQFSFTGKCVNRPFPINLDKLLGLYQSYEDLVKNVAKKILLKYIKISTPPPSIISVPRILEGKDPIKLIYSLLEEKKSTSLNGEVVQALHQYIQEKIRPFFEAVRKGIFFTLISKGQVTRDQVKQEFFKLLFGGITHLTHSNNIGQLFPTFHYWVHAISQVLGEQYEAPDQIVYDYMDARKVSLPKLKKSALSVLLQSIEAGVFIQDVLHGMVSHRIPALSRHDSVLIPESKKEEAKVILESVLGSYFGHDGYSYSINSFNI